MTKNAFCKSFSNISSSIARCWYRLCSGLHFVFVILLWSKLFGPNQTAINRPLRQRRMAAKTPHSSNSVDGDNRNTPPSVREIRQRNRNAYDYISQALAIDEGEGKRW